MNSIMNGVIKRLLCLMLFMNFISPARPVTLSKPIAIGGAIVTGALCSAATYGIYRLVHNNTDKKHEALFSSKKKSLDLELKRVEKELSEESLLGTGQESNKKRIILVSTLVISVGILGGIIAYQLLKKLTTEGRLDAARNLINKVGQKRLMQRLLANDPRIRNEIDAEFGATRSLLDLNDFVDQSLTRLGQAGKALCDIAPGQCDEACREQRELIDRYTGILRPLQAQILRTPDYSYQVTQDLVHRERAITKTQENREFWTGIGDLATTGIQLTRALTRQ